MEQHNITWRGIGIEITFAPEKFGMADHIELRTEGKAALPVTETGYRSHFLPAGTVARTAARSPSSPLGSTTRRSGAAGAARSSACSSRAEKFAAGREASREEVI